MDSSEGGDDQGSGWMQVKKKHRSNSKFSLHGGAAKLSGKRSSVNPSNIPSPGHKFENSLNESQPSNASGDSSVPEIHNALNTTSISAEKVVVDDYIPKSVVSKYGNLDSCHSSAIDTASSYKLSFDPLHSDKSNILPKIKWGDLDEGTLMHYVEISGAEVNIGEVKNHNEHKEFGEAVNEDQILPMSPMSQCVSPKIISVEEICKEVNEVPSEDVKEQITIEEVVSETDFDEEYECLKPENDDSLDTFGENIVHETIEDEGMRITSNFKSNSGHYISEVPITVSASSTGPTLPKDSEFGIVSDSASTASNEESTDRKKEANSNNFLDTQHADATNAEDMDESKERFRERLWCFLFENLNRAVDELYLLCELECDLDQMKEASLVLEEAASDFRELKSRVEKFEKMKRSHEIEGSPLIMQSDHRRPHALSWEVRRMTTSPRRADVLSSSLEAFRKIQQERSGIRTKNDVGSDYHYHHIKSSDIVCRSKESTLKTRTLTGMLDASDGSTKERRHVASGKSGSVASKLPIKEGSEICTNAKSNRELHGSTSEAEKLLNKKAKMLSGHYREKNSKSVDSVRRHVPVPEREREKKIGNSGMDAWKEKRNWEDILASPHRISSRFSYSPGFGRKSAERVRVLHDKLMSPEKKKKSGVDLRKEAEEKHARATRIRAQLENERVQKLQRTSEKQNRVNEWQTVRSNKLRESIFDRHQRSESRHEAYLAQVVRRAGDESSKVNEVRFITSLNEENKKHILRKKLQDSEVRRAEKLQVIKTKQKEDMAREEAVLERKRLIEAEKLQRLAETQRKKEEAQVRWEEERKASNAAREAKALEKMRKKEIRAKARKEEAELLAQKLAERLSESEQRRKFYLEQIREKASMDFRDQSSPFLRRIASKEVQAQGNIGDLVNNSCSMAGSGSSISESRQHLLKRRIKKIRQRLMSLKHEFLEPAVGLECSSIGYRTAVGTTRGKIGRWIQDLQKLRQARKEGAANFGLITAEMIKFVEGRDAELHASRQAGLLDFIASALPASHTCKPEACRVTIYLLRLLRIVLAMPANRCYFLVQNLLPPIIPMLAAALENYIKMAASSSSTGQTTSVSNKTAIGNLESVSEIVDGFLWIVAAIIGYGTYNENQLQMQDGLAELVIAYQIIQRLRDLFALYDRPQVEGSPFPSSILLSINLLVVLTSKFRESSSIDWESFPREIIHGNKLEWINLPERENVPECTSLNETSTIEGADALILLGKKSDDVELVASKVKTSDVMDESSRAPTDDKCENLSFQKNGSNSASNGVERIDGYSLNLKHPAKFLLSAMAETGLVCLPSMLTAVLLQANNRLSAEQGSYALPSNFEEVATGVLKVLNNLALVDVTFIQKMLARPDLKMEFFHLLSFLLSHCTSNWGVANDKIGLLLLESLSLLGYFALFHSGNQAVLRWGKSPTILHKVCDLPFVFFSDPELMPVLASTLVAASYGCEQNKAVIQQELSMDMLISSLKSCKTTISIQNGPSAEASGEPNQTSLDFKKLQADASQKLNRNSVKPTRVPQKGGVFGNNVRATKIRNQRDIKLLKACEEMHMGPGQSDASILMLHCRFPGSFIDKAEQFFTAEINTSNGEFI